MIPSPGRGASDQRLTARVAPGINLGVVQQGKKIFGQLWKNMEENQAMAGWSS